MRDYAHDNLAAELFDHSPVTWRGRFTPARVAIQNLGHPGRVRYRLADKALGDYDIALAAKLVHDLKTPAQR